MPDTPVATDPNPALALWGGVECTINRVGDVYRDQARLSGHNDRPDDLERFAALGISALRYPLLWEAFAMADDPERLWTWHDARLDRLHALGIRPILGLIHHGSGPPGTDLLADDFAEGLARHAALAAARYPWVRDWTPVNEPLTTARFSALYGHWYPHRRDEAAFWHALVGQIEATAAAMAAIRAIIPDARLIQTEDLGHTGSTRELRDQADFDNERRWASWDMLAGRFTPEHPLWRRAADAGLAARLEALAAAPCAPDVLGLNHYLTSDRYLDHRLDRHPVDSHGQCPLGPLADVAAVRAEDDAPGLEGALRATWGRYGIPLALTEVHNGCTREEQMRWLGEAWGTATRLRSEGIAIEAVTAWSLLGAHDWCSLLTKAEGRYESGVFDIRGDAPRATALAPMLRQLSSGGTPDHPVLQNGGWWRDHAALGRAPARPLVITGATGTLGQAFAGACRVRGIDHRLTDRAMLDLTDPASIERALDDAQPWAVVNCAGWVRVDEAEAQADRCMAVNHVGNLALAEACARRGIHYTCFSSDLVFDGRANRAYVESDVPAPLNVYGASKARTDAALQEASGRALVVRTASFFSPFDGHNFAMHVVASLRDGRPFRAVGDCITSPTFVPDLVRTTLDLIIDDETGLWHLVSDGAVSWAGFARKIADAVALPVALIEERALRDMSWPAPRPRHAPLATRRGQIMPSLSSAIDRFARELAAPRPPTPPPHA